MDEPMTPMERLVVEYHVWKTQLFKPDNIMLACNHGEEFIRFKQTMADVDQKDFEKRVADAWGVMNPLDLGKALGQYESDCPDLRNCGVDPVKKG